MNPPPLIWNSLLVVVCLTGLHCGCFAQQPVGQSPNLLKNPEFEKGLEGWEFSAWQDKTAKAVIDRHVTHNEGAASVRIDHPNVTDSHVAQVATLKPNTRYRLSGWIKTDNVVKPAIANQRPGDEGASLGTLGGYVKSKSITGTQDWTYVSLEFATKDKTEVRLGPRLGHYGKKVTGTAWFADISLVEIGDALNNGDPTPHQ
jgi:hypothetical protein